MLALETALFQKDWYSIARVCCQTWPKKNPVLACVEHSDKLVCVFREGGVGGRRCGRVGVNRAISSLHDIQRSLRAAPRFLAISSVRVNPQHTKAIHTHSWRRNLTREGPCSQETRKSDCEENVGTVSRPLLLPIQPPCTHPQREGSTCCDRY